VAQPRISPAQEVKRSWPRLPDGVLALSGMQLQRGMQLQHPRTGCRHDAHRGHTTAKTSDQAIWVLPSVPDGGWQLAFELSVIVLSRSNGGGVKAEMTCSTDAIDRSP